MLLQSVHILHLGELLVHPVPHQIRPPTQLVYFPLPQHLQGVQLSRGDRFVSSIFRIWCTSGCDSIYPSYPHTVSLCKYKAVNPCEVCFLASVVRADICSISPLRRCLQEKASHPVQVHRASLLHAALKHLQMTRVTLWVFFSQLVKVTGGRAALVSWCVLIDGCQVDAGRSSSSHPSTKVSRKHGMYIRDACMKVSFFLSLSMISHEQWVWVEWHFNCSNHCFYQEQAVWFDYIEGDNKSIIGVAEGCEWREVARATAMHPTNQLMGNAIYSPLVGTMISDIIQQEESFVPCYLCTYYELNLLDLAAPLQPLVRPPIMATSKYCVILQGTCWLLFSSSISTCCMSAGCSSFYFLLPRVACAFLFLYSLLLSLVLLAVCQPVVSGRMLLTHLPSHRQVYQVTTAWFDWCICHLHGAR